MPSKKRAIPASIPEPLTRLRDAMTTLQHDAETLLRRTRTRATALLSRDRRRASDSLFGQATQLRKSLEKQVQQATRDFEARAERLRSAIEGQLSRRVGALLKGLDLPTRREVHRLTARIGELEHRLRSPARRGRTARKSGSAKRRRG